MTSSGRSTIERIRYRGGPLNGALLELPASYRDRHPSDLRVTPAGAVFDRVKGYTISSARVIEPPTPVLAEEPPKRKTRRRGVTKSTD